MYELKTRVNDADVVAFIQGVENERRREDALVLLDLMAEVTGLEPRMWGPSIIGFGSYHYRYESGHEGDMAMIGFSPRKTNLVVYIVPGFESYEALLQRLGKYRSGKSCLYLNKLHDVDMAVLRELARDAFESTRETYLGK